MSLVDKARKALNKGTLTIIKSREGVRHFGSTLPIGYLKKEDDK